MLLKTESDTTFANFDIGAVIPMSIKDVLNKIGSDGLCICSVDLTLHLITGEAITINPQMWDMSSLFTMDEE